MNISDRLITIAQYAAVIFFMAVIAPLCFVGMAYVADMIHATAYGSFVPMMLIFATLFIIGILFYVYVWLHLWAFLKDFSGHLLVIIEKPFKNPNK